MNKRLGFILVLSALGWAGCDENPPPADAGCRDGEICEFPDSGVPDSGMRDSGPDSGTPSGCVQSTGRAGGTCRTGGVCGPGLTCAPDLTRFPTTGATITLQNAFEIPTAVPDPENPGEFLTAADFDPTDPERPEFPDVPIGFGPGGQCTQGCNPRAATDSCPTCSTCETDIGGSPVFGAVGISVRTFDGTDPSITNETNTGMCRADCEFNPATNGGCQSGYSCEPSANVCLEACTADSQCNLDWGVTRRDGLVAVVDGTATCNTSTGRCQWTPPTGSGYGSECESNRDCPADIGVCIFGHCSTWQCNQPDDTGASRYPCPTGAVCVGFGGNDAAACLTTCTNPSECFPDQACTALFADGSRACFGYCEANTDCQSDRRCRRGGFTDPNLGTCRPHCDPADETACGDNEVCVQAEGETYGFCEQRGQICSADADCLADEACEWLGNDGLARCVPACVTDENCAEGSFCRIAPSFVRVSTVNRETGVINGTGAPESTVTVTIDGVEAGTATVSATGAWTLTVPEAMRPISADAVVAATGSTDSTQGVCRVPGEACSPSPRRTDNSIIFHLRGDGSPQCVPWQTCSATMPDVLGTCVGDPPAEG